MSVVISETPCIASLTATVQADLSVRLAASLECVDSTGAVVPPPAAITGYDFTRNGTSIGSSTSGLLTDTPGPGDHEYTVTIQPGGYPASASASIAQVGGVVVFLPARITGAGQVALRWFWAPGAGFPQPTQHVLTGPGIPGGSVTLTGATFTYDATGVPNGLQTWNLTTTFDNGTTDTASVSFVVPSGSIHTFRERIVESRTGIERSLSEYRCLDWQVSGDTPTDYDISYTWTGERYALFFGVPLREEAGESGSMDIMLSELTPAPGGLSGIVSHPSQGGIYQNELYPLSGFCVAVSVGQTFIALNTIRRVFSLQSTITPVYSGGVNGQPVNHIFRVSRESLLPMISISPVGTPGDPSFVIEYDMSVIIVGNDGSLTRTKIDVFEQQQISWRLTFQRFVGTAGGGWRSFVTLGQAGRYRNQSSILRHRIKI